MAWQDLMAAWRLEYWGWQAADPNATKFYDFLLTRANRFVLSAHGIGRDVAA